MENQNTEPVKLGAFVLAGLLLLIVTLYVIGKNKGLFSNSFELKTHFRAVNGLLTGNNVRFAGIDVGAVKSVVFLNDTVIEVTMNVETKMRNIIRRNALASLGTDGLIGNGVVNIQPARGETTLVKAGDLIPSKEEISTDAMLQTLHTTNENVAAISEELLITVRRIRNSTQLAQLLDDGSISADLKASLAHLHETTEKAAALMTDASQTLALASTGHGPVATLLTDTSMAYEMTQVVQKIKIVEESADHLANTLDQMAVSVGNDLNEGQGTVQALLKDTIMANQLRLTMNNVQAGTAAFNQNMEALKHNFLFRKYFKKMDRKKKQ